MKVNLPLVRIIIGRQSHTFRSDEIPMFRLTEMDVKSVQEQMLESIRGANPESGETPPNSNVIPFSPDQNTK